MKHRTHTSRREFLRLATLGAGSLIVTAACSPAAPPAATPAPAAPAAPTATSPPAAPTTAAAPTATTAAAAKPTEAPKPAATPAASTAPSSSSGKASGKVVWLVRVVTPQEVKALEDVVVPLVKQQTPNVDLERITLPGDQYFVKIDAMTAAKQQLDVWGWGGNYYDYYWRNMANDVSSYVKADKWDIDEYFLPSLATIFRVRGKQYGLPQLSSFGSPMVYNKKLFDEAGLAYPTVNWDDESWNMDKVVELGQKLTKNWGKPDGQYGVRMGLWPNEAAYPYLWGGDAYLPEHYTNFIAPKTNFNSPAVIDSHQFRQDLIYKLHVSPDPAADSGLAQIASPFKTGRIGMEMDGGWLWRTAQGITDFKVGFAALPRAKTNKTIHFTDQWIMSRNAVNKDGAWALIRILTSVDVQNKLATGAGTPPTVRACLDTWLKGLSDYTGQTIEDLKTCVNGSLEAKRVQESPDHLFIQYTKIQDTYSNEISPIWQNRGSAAEIVPKVAQRLDDVVGGIYNQFKDTMPKD